MLRLEHNEAVRPIAVFLVLYLSLLAALVQFMARSDLMKNQWAGFVAVSIASVVSCAISNPRWRLGLDPSRITVDALTGIGIATVLIGGADLLIGLTTSLRHARGASLPWREILLVFIPAAVHEELLFRGFIFQKLIHRSRLWGTIGASLLFGLLHIGNRSVGFIAIFNIFLAGLLLSLAYLLAESLWMPIFLHTWWNIFSGPVLGHEVSGFVIQPTLFRTIDHGPAALTGGSFGIEASIWTSLMEIAGIAALAWRIRRRSGPFSSTADAG
ncbi:MAG TPA: CPBP family intramembrane glutamic endopeptidase [Thermoanaerobaculia bacterium]|nr:CPBP family intramembrane glutamic endopeptidase [Thermoanaerobaculia bacterium]